MLSFFGGKIAEGETSLRSSLLLGHVKACAEKTRPQTGRNFYANCVRVDIMLYLGPLGFGAWAKGGISVYEYLGFSCCEIAEGNHWLPRGGKIAGMDGSVAAWTRKAYAHVDAVQKCNRSHIMTSMMLGTPHLPRMQPFLVSKSAPASGFVWRSRTGGFTTTSGSSIVRR